MNARRILRLAWRALAALVLLLAVVYVCDDLSLRFGIPSGRQTYGTIQVRQYYEIPQKNNRVQFMPADPATVTCVHSLFPHFGYSPCWYASRHTLRKIEM